MPVTRLAVVIFFLAGIAAGIGQAASPVCPNIVTAKLAEEQKECLRRIVPLLVKAFPNLLQDKSDTSLHNIYEAFCNKFNRRVTKLGFSHFLQSLNVISSIYCEIDVQPAYMQPHLENIQSLAQQFSLAYGGRDFFKLYESFTKILKVKDYNVTDESGRKRRQINDCFDNTTECECPEGGINSHEIFCPCQFFNCLDQGRNLMPVFEGMEGFECLAFVLDTTGSMKDENNATLQVARDFISSEELGCYMLVPFNDAKDSSVGPVTMTYVDDANPNSITSLKNLVNDLDNAFRPNSGGDCPEFCYDGIIEAFNYVYDGYSVMAVEGSQVIVITDAPSKGNYTSDDVINLANENDVCIHFFLGGKSKNCFEDIPGSIDEYKKIASETGGTVVSSKFDFTVFVQRYKESPCGFLEPNDRRRRSDEDTPCQSFSVSSLGCLLTLAIETKDKSVTLTRPNGTQVIINVTNPQQHSEQEVVLYSEVNPPSGTWEVCGERPIKVSKEEEICVNFVALFIAQTVEGIPCLTAETPPCCTSVQIVMTSTEKVNIHSPSLYLLDGKGKALLRTSLENCSGLLSAHLTLPVTGSYYYQLHGEDSSGNSFSHLIQPKIPIKSGEEYYNLTDIGPDTVYIVRGEVANVSFRLNSSNRFGSTTFHFSIAQTDTPSYRIVPPNVTLTFGKSVNVVVQARISTQQQVTLIASNNCSELTATKSVVVTSPVTTVPTPGACQPECLNGGTCSTIRRRQREFHICRCTPRYRGRSCQTLN